MTPLNLIWVLVWSGAALERAPSVDGEFHEFDGLELAEVEAGREHADIEAGQQLSIDVHPMKLIDVIFQVQQMQTLADLHTCSVNNERHSWIETH